MTTPTPSNLTRTLSVACLACWISAAVSAQDLLDQPPSQAFSVYDFAGTQSIADNFVVASAGGTTLSQVTWWGTWEAGGTSPADTFEIRVHGNAPAMFGDVPSGLIANFSGVVPTVTATGANLQTFSGLQPEYELSATLPGGVALAPGTYWVEIYSNSDSGSLDNFSWEMAPQDMANGAPCVSWRSLTPGGAWNACTPFPETDMALRLTSAGSLGTNYCSVNNNSTGSPAMMSVGGSLNIADANVVLSASPVPNEPFIFYMGPNQIQAPFGDGFRCVGGSVTRIWPPNAASGNLAMRTVDMGALSITPGTWNVQCWFRDPAPAMSGFNLSDGAEIVLAP